MTHTLYMTGDANCPEAILDHNGEVVLALCKTCGKGESDLSAGCISEDRERLADCLRKVRTYMKTQMDYEGQRLWMEIIDTLRATNMEYKK